LLELGPVGLHQFIDLVGFYLHRQLIKVTYFPDLRSYSRRSVCD
jgi:hypothetical protein